MSTKARATSSKIPNRRLALKPIARAARNDVLKAFDSLLEKFIGSDVLRDVILEADPTDPVDLHRSYLRLRDAAAALNQWHTNGAYLTKDGCPRLLRREGKVSLTSLALSVCPNSPAAKQLVGDMIEFGFVSKSGAHFTPEMRSAVVGQPTPLILAHATAAIIRLIGTVTHNVSGGVPARYERHVADVRIRATDLPVFLRFVEQQGQYLIDSVDDWLAKRELEGAPREREVTVGIGAFAWVDPAKASPIGSTVRGGAIVPRK